MLDTTSRTVPAEELTALATAVLRAAGTPPDVAELVAGSLVESNLVGHDSHGVRRLTRYVAAIEDGALDPTARPVVERTEGAVATVGGRWAFGQLSARLATEQVGRLATAHGVGTAVIRECNHVGRLGEYVEQLAAGDHIALALSNADPAVAPYGGFRRMLGTNPMAWGVPRAAGADPLVMDWASAAVAEGKLAEARDRGRTVAPGLLLDQRGHESVDPHDFYAGGALLPFGGHKGYGLSVVIEILGGLLSGTGIGSRPGYDGGFGTFVAAFRIDAFTAAEQFRTEVEEFCRELSGSPPAAGHQAVLVPGELEARTKAQRSADGIPLAEETWRRLQELLARR